MLKNVTYKRHRGYIVDMREIFPPCVRWQDGLGTGRYDRSCGGCPPWEECYNCTVHDSNLDPTCSIALKDTTAIEPSNTLETLSGANGSWRATNTSRDILACLNNVACLGGQTGAEPFVTTGTWDHASN